MNSLLALVLFPNCGAHGNLTRTGFGLFLILVGVILLWRRRAKMKRFSQLTATPAWTKRLFDFSAKLVYVVGILFIVMGGYVLTGAAGC